MSLVIDSSITLAWLFEDERTPAAEAVLRRVGESGATAPSLWRLEVANGLQTAVRRKRIDAAARDASIADLRTLNVSIDAHTDTQAWTTTLQLAEGQSVYLTVGALHPPRACETGWLGRAGRVLAASCRSRLTRAWAATRSAAIDVVKGRET